MRMNRGARRDGKKFNNKIPQKRNAPYHEEFFFLTSSACSWNKIKSWDSIENFSMYPSTLLGNFLFFYFLLKDARWESKKICKSMNFFVLLKTIFGLKRIVIGGGTMSNSKWRTFELLKNSSWLNWESLEVLLLYWLGVFDVLRLFRSKTLVSLRVIYFENLLIGRL